MERFWAGGVIGPYFCENMAEQAVMVYGKRYGSKTNDFLWPELETMDLNNVWFQQDGAPCQTARETIGRAI